MKEMKGTKVKSGFLVTKIIVFIIFVAYSITLIYPVVWALVQSFNDNFLFFRDPFALPPEWHFENWPKAFELISVRGSNPLRRTNLIGLFGNSIWLTGIGTLISIFVPSMTAYVTSKYNFKMRGFIYSLAIFIMIIPIVGALPAQYKLYRQLGLYNSPLILLTYTGGFGFNFIVLYGYFKNISWSYAEAAFMDGASNLKVFLYIMLPLAMPCMASLYIIAFIGGWNDYTTPYLFLPDFPTIASGLYIFGLEIKDANTNYPVYFAGILMSMIPIMTLFVLFSETIMQNTVAGGLKG